MTTLILVRHAQSEANVELIAEGGGGNSPLTDEGRQQAERLSMYLQETHAQISHIYSSPQIRAHDTAKAVALRFTLEIQLDHDLREGMLGTWEGSPPSRDLDWEGLNTDPHYNEHGGESPFQLGRRCGEQIKEIAAQHPAQTVLVVSHGAALSHGLAHVLGTEPVSGKQYKHHNTGITLLDWRDHPPELLSVNQRPHLEEIT